MTMSRGASFIDRGGARILRRWDAFKAAHPALGQLLAPFLRRLWIRAVLRRPSLAHVHRGPDADAGAPSVRAALASRAIRQPVVEDREALVAACVDHAFAVPDVGVFLVGWLFDPLGRISSLTAHVGGTASVDVLPDLVRTPRPDVAQSYRSWSHEGDGVRHGFSCLVPLGGVSAGQIVTSLSIVFADEQGGSWSVSPQAVAPGPGSPLPLIRELLTLVPPRDAETLERHLGPAVSALWRDRPRSVEAIEVGRVPGDPRVSIVVPVYGRIDLIEHQLALFADDPDIRTAELIYVIDDPRIRDEAVRLCRDIEPLFRVASRLVLNEQNLGFARSTNIGAGLARAPVLLLLNSDVMPIAPGWLSGLLEAQRSLPVPGALGPRLLYPDGSLQHAGMEFVEEAWLPGIWLNDHPGKGLPPPAVSGPQEPVRVPALTAACLMVSADLYRLVGGLDEDYIIGDFEDSDLCLKLRRLGHPSYVAPWIELVHLERQSQRLDGDTDWRQALTLYNAWLHTRRWSDVIEGIRAEAAHA